MKVLPVREGAKPLTTPSNPHTQLDQQPEDRKLINELMAWAYDLPDVIHERSQISVPGAQAMCLPLDKTCSDCAAFMVGTELTHFHPFPDASMHMSLPLDDVRIVIEKGWGELHPVVSKGWLPANFIMLFAPRNPKEADIAQKIIYRSYQFAIGDVA